MNRKLTLMVSLLLLVSLLLQGCLPGLSKQSEPSTSTQLPTATESSETTEPPETTESQPEIDYHNYPRDISPLYSMTAFQDMEYSRPETEPLLERFAQIQKDVESGSSADDVLESYLALDDDCRVFSTMGSIAYIRHCIDLNDEFYTAESEWCQLQTPLLLQAEELLFIAMSKSEIRDELEEKHFEEGFFEFYDKNQIYSNDRVVELLQREAELENAYMALQSDQTILWNGEERLYAEVEEETAQDYQAQMEVYRTYYSKYAPLCADLFIQLIRIRKEIAQETSYDSYADFAYQYTFRRDYTPEQADDYMKGICQELSVLFMDSYQAHYDRSMEIDEVLEQLQELSNRFGGGFAPAYDLLMDYELCDFSESTSKMPGSFMTYLHAYEVPFLYVSPTGTTADLLTTAHEFGHFVDGFVNCGETDSIDVNEIFSQGLEYLLLTRGDMRSKLRRMLTASKLGDSVQVFLGQACYADFESQVYKLSEAELTEENISKIFADCYASYILPTPGMEDIVGRQWIDVMHFFMEPYYVISYCVSNDVALQIFLAEENGEDGLKLYNDLMAAASGNTILALCEEVGLISPFEEGHLAELARIYATYLK